MKGELRQFEEDSQKDSSICDKSAQLWTVALNRRKKDPNPLTSPQPALMTTMLANPQKHLQQLQQQHKGQIAENKHKQVEIELLSQQVKALLIERQQLEQKHIKNLENSSVRFSPNPREDKVTVKTMKRGKKQSQTVTQVIQQDTPLEQLNQEKIVALLKNTSQYQQFAEYYQNHALTYLQIASQQRSKPRPQDSKHASDDQIFQEMQRLNRRENWGLSKYHQELILAHMQHYYQNNTRHRLKRMSRSYQGKIRKEKVSQQAAQVEVEKMRRHKEAELTRQLVHSTKK